MLLATDEPAIPALPGPFSTPPSPEGIRPTRATRALVAHQVDALLAASQAFHELPPAAQAELRAHVQHIAAYSAELVRDDWYQSARLSQRPLVRQRATLRPAGPADPPAAHGPRGAGNPVPAARAQAASDGLGTGATSRVGEVTRQTLRAISFPEFVADLIRSTFRAIVDASIQQLEAIRALLGNVSGTVDEFEEQNITDSQAREWLAQQYATHLQLQGGRLAARPDAPEAPPPWQSHLGLPRPVDPGDEDALEEVLVPAARRKLSQGRLETLSLLVLMGTDRIVVTGGKIRATMAFHIDASDAARQANASEFDMRVSAAGSVGFGPWSASVSTSGGYVSSARSESESEINVAADLTGEVELHFRTDPVALDRLISGPGIDRIVANTPVPSANAEAIPWGSSPESRVAPTARRTSARIERPMREAPALPTPPSLPTPRATPAPATPVAPAAPAATPAPAAAPAPAATPAPATPVAPAAPSGAATRPAPVPTSAR